MPAATTMRAAGWSLLALRRDAAASTAGRGDRYGEDRELVARMLAGDQAAVDGFGERYGAALYRFAAARLGADRELTCDIVQTTLLKALARLDSYRGEAALLTWLCACCRNEILMHRRRTGGGTATAEPSTLEGIADVAAESDAEAALLAKERKERVHLTLDSLPARYARALEWKYLDRLPVEAIAARLGLGLKAAESLLGRARRSFRNTFEDHARGEAAETGHAQAPAGNEP